MMPESQKKHQPLLQRIKIMLVSIITFGVTIACSIFEKHDNTPEVVCYTTTPTPVPETVEVLCYEPTIEVPEVTPSPTLTCYTATPSSTLAATGTITPSQTLSPTATSTKSPTLTPTVPTSTPSPTATSTQSPPPPAPTVPTHTPTPSPYPSPVCYTATPTNTPTPTTSAQSPQTLLEQLLAEGRFPACVLRELS